MSERDRNLEWEGCYNVRDLGGLPLAGGGQTRFGAYVRADVLGRLTPRGKQQLLAYGVNTIIDLRMPHEIAEEPSAVFDDAANAPDYLQLDPMEPKPEVRARLKAAQSRADKYTLVLDGFPSGNARVLRALAAARPGGIVFHCHAGKDRTGLTAALLLDLVGVEHEAIVQDYTISQQRLRPFFQQWLADLERPEEVDPWWIPITDPQNMRRVLTHLQEQYGGAAGYLAQAGLSPGELASLRRRLVGTSWSV